MNSCPLICGFDYSAAAMNWAEEQKTLQLAACEETVKRFLLWTRKINCELITKMFVAKICACFVIVMLCRVTVSRGELVKNFLFIAERILITRGICEMTNFVSRENFSNQQSFVITAFGRWIYVFERLVNVTHRWNKKDPWRSRKYQTCSYIQ